MGKEKKIKKRRNPSLLPLRPSHALLGSLRMAHLPLAHLLAAAQRPQTLAAWVSQPSRHPACGRAGRGARPCCSPSRRNNRAHVVQIPGKNGFPSLPRSSQRFSLARRRAGRNRVAGLELARSSTAPVEVNPPSPSLPRPPFFFVAMRVWASVAVRGSPMAASTTSAVRGSPMAARRARALARPRPGLGLSCAVRCAQRWPFRLQPGVAAAWCARPVPARAAAVANPGAARCPWHAASVARGQPDVSRARGLESLASTTRCRRDTSVISSRPRPCSTRRARGCTSRLSSLPPP